MVIDFLYELRDWLIPVAYTSYTCVFLFLFIRICIGVVIGFVDDNKVIFDKKRRCNAEYTIKLMTVTNKKCIFKREDNGETYIIDRDNIISNINETSLGYEYTIFVNKDNPDEYFIPWALKGQYKFNPVTVCKGVYKEIITLVVVYLLWSNGVSWV